MVAGQGTGESLSVSSSNTSPSGVATVRLITNTVSGSEYQVRCWVTEASLLNAFGSFEALASNVMNSTSTSATASPTRGSNFGSISGISGDRKRIDFRQSDSFTTAEMSNFRSDQFVPVHINRPSSSFVDRNLNRDAIFDLDDTTAVVLVWPGVTASVSVPQTATDLLLEDEFGLTLDAYDQFLSLIHI